ncbi:ccr4 associated factor [Lecanora helva]
MSLYSTCHIFKRYSHCPKASHKLLYRLISTGGVSPQSAQYVPLPSRRLISLHGQDASHFLQGLVTSNIPPVPALHSHYSAFLNASGRVLHDVFIYNAAKSREYRDLVLQGKEEPGLLIEVDANEVENLARHLKRFKLRAKVGITILEDEEWGVWQATGTCPQDALPNGGENEIWCPDQRAPGMGHRIIQPRKRPRDGERETTSEQYLLRRILKGVAEGQGEIMKESALPQESNIDYMGGIDFRKGCYVGQELTIRVHHTGIVRKRILPVQIHDIGVKPSDEMQYDPKSRVALPPQGVDISRADKKSRSAGKWLGGVGNVGLALCRLEVMTDTALTAEGSQWSPDHEFKMAWKADGDGTNQEVKVKAFVPSWHQERAEGQSKHLKKSP